MSVTFKKQFSKSDFDKYDDKARRAVVAHYAANGIVLVDNPDRFRADLICVNSGRLIEVEIRQSWKGDAWTFSDYTIEMRKYAYDQSFDLITLNATCTHAVICPASVMFKYRENVIEKKTRYSEMSEKFVSVPSEELILIKLATMPDKAA